MFVRRGVVSGQTNRTAKSLEFLIGVFVLGAGVEVDLAVMVLVGVFGGLKGRKFLRPARIVVSLNEKTISTED